MLTAKQLRDMLQSAQETAQVFIIVNGQPVPLRLVSNVTKYYVPKSGDSMPMPPGSMAVHLET